MNKTLKLIFILLLLNLQAFPQLENMSDTLFHKSTLDDCIRYAFGHQPVIQQSLLDEQITNHEVNSKLADWFPQLNLNMNFIHNYKLPVSIIGGAPVATGLRNTSSMQFALTQT